MTTTRTVSFTVDTDDDKRADDVLDTVLSGVENRLEAHAEANAESDDPDPDITWTVHETIDAIDMVHKRTRLGMISRVVDQAALLQSMRDALPDVDEDQLMFASLSDAQVLDMLARFDRPGVSVNRTAATDYSAEKAIVGVLLPGGDHCTIDCSGPDQSRWSKSPSVGLAVDRVDVARRRRRVRRGRVVRCWRRRHAQRPDREGRGVMRTKQTVELEHGDVAREFQNDAWKVVDSAEIVPFTGAVHTAVRFTNGCTRTTGSVMPWQVADDITPLDKRPKRERATGRGLRAGDRIRYLLKDDQGGPAWRECDVRYDCTPDTYLVDVRHDDGETEGIGMPWPVQVRRDGRWQ